MSFEPNRINKEHVLKAVERIEQNQITLINSTGYNVIINNKNYPPKEIMRYAHEEMNGEHIWEFGGGDKTNSYLINMGFTVLEKKDIDSKVGSLIKKFKDYLKESELKDEIYKWQIIKKQQGMPDLNAKDFEAEIKKIDFRNLVYNLVPQTSKELARLKPDEYKEALKYLFDEEISLDERITEFEKRVDKIYYEIFPEGNKKASHDERTASFFLTLHNPAKYTFYKSSFYTNYCQLLGISTKNKGGKYSHYLELVQNLIDEYIVNDNELKELVKSYLDDSCYSDENYMLLAQDILYEMLEKEEVKNFTWIPIYKEIAEKLLSYKNDRKYLIDMISKMKEVGLKTLSLNDKSKAGKEFDITINDIDPFTFFANFNRGITDKNRQDIITFIRKEWSLKSKIPEDFIGVPIVNNQKAWFFSFEYKRGTKDIELLWELFEQAITKSIDEISEDLFDNCLMIKGIGANLTFGIYWINPEYFLPLDKNTREYLNKHFNKNVKRIVLTKHNGYKEIISQIKTLTELTFYELSYEAWKERNSSSSIVLNDELIKEFLNTELYKDFKKLSLPEKIKREKEAWSLLEDNQGKVNNEILEKFIELVDTRDGKSGWFGLMLKGNNKNLLLSAEPDNLNEWLNDLLFSDLEIEEALENSLTEMKITGAGFGFISLLIYLSSPKDYNIYIPRIAQKTFEIITNVNLKNKSSEVDKYFAFNDVTNQIRDKYKLLPQEMDWFVNNIQLYFSSKQDAIIKEDIINNRENKMGLNTILFGPPGTGKTYETISKAVQIIEDLEENELKIEYPHRQELRDKYQEYLSQERIRFVTFHQSFSYEDFIEGIKPVLIKDDEDSELNRDIKYRIEDGVFKEIASKAIAARTKVVSGSRYFIDKKNFENVQYYKMSLGNTAIEEESINYEYCIENSLIGLGYGYDIDFSGVQNEDDIIQKYENNRYTIEKNNDYRVTAIKIFLLWLKKGDIVFISNGNKKLRAVGKVKSDRYIYKKDSSINYSQFREVEWLLKDVDIPIESFYYKKFSQQTIYKMFSAKVDTSLFTKSDIQEKGTDKYVLIIDEINRGNIASIFGELITLIEKDKRLGASEGLRITLPYSKESFEVPDNLYLIGTMNTADRSVEALDTALRRRFDFVEVQPNYDLINPSSLIISLWQQYEKVRNWFKEPFYSKAIRLYEFLGFKDPEFKESAKYWDEIVDNYWDIDRGRLISENEFNGFRPDLMLVKINQRIERLLDSDHCIGHAYFMSLSDCEDPLLELRYIFKNKIIPLLKEYFYGDLAKIGLILGKDFIEYETINDKGNIFADFDYDNIDEFEEIKPIKIKDVDLLDLSSFRKIYEQKQQK